MNLSNRHSTLCYLLFVSFFLSTGYVTAQEGQSPPQQRITIMQYAINERPLLAELLTTAGLAPALSGDTPYTLLAPPEASLQELKGQSAEKIRATLAMHIIKGRHQEADFKDGARIDTYSGAAAHVCRKKSDTLISGVKIMAANKEVRNGVVHELNGLLTP